MHSALSLTRTSIRRVVYRSLAWIGEEVFGMQPRSVILCYHSIADDNWFHAVTEKAFVMQVGLLREKGYRFISLTQLVESLREKKSLPDPFCVITFDDGCRDVLAVKDFLHRESIVPTIFVLAEPQIVSRAEIGTDRKFLSVEEIRTLASAGWDIGCHSARHKNLASADNTTLQHEIIHSRELLKKELDLPVDFFAYPFGAYVYQSVAYVRRGGYRAALSMDDSLSITTRSIWTLPRIGINRTYSLAEFAAALSPLSILFRKFVKIIL